MASQQARLIARVAKVSKKRVHVFFEEEAKRVFWIFCQKVGDDGLAPPLWQLSMCSSSGTEFPLRMRLQQTRHMFLGWPFRWLWHA